MHRNKIAKMNEFFFIIECIQQLRKTLFEIYRQVIINQFQFDSFSFIVALSKAFQVRQKTFYAVQIINIDKITVK